MIMSAVTNGQWRRSILRQLASFAICVFLGATASPAQSLGDGLGEIDLEFPPIAIAGDDQVVGVGDLVRLDGSASNDDADAGTIEAYDWSLSSIVANNDRAAFIPEVRGYFRSLTLVGADTATPTLVLPTLPSGVFKVDLVVDLVVTDGVGNTSWASAGSDVMITVLAEVPNAPINITTTENAGTINVTFDLADDGGTPVTDVQYRLNGGAWQSTGSAAYAFSLSGLDAMVSHVLEIRAENAAGVSVASSAKTLTLPNPRTAFEEVQSAYVSALRDEAARLLEREQASAQRVVQSARDRLVASLAATRAVNGAVALSTKCIAEGADDCLGRSRDVFSSGKTFASLSADGATTGSDARLATFSLAHEFTPSSETRLGFMMRAALSDQDAAGAFTGNITTRAGSVGLFGVTALGDGLYLDGFMMLGRSRQSVALRADAISMTSDYWATNSLAGMSLSGSYSAGEYAFLPTLSATVARGQIGAIKSDVRGFDLVAEDIMTDLGSVRSSEIALSTELRRNLWADRAGYVAFTPKVSCSHSNAAILRDGCQGSAEIKLKLETTHSGPMLMLSIARDDLRRQGTSTVAAEVSAQF